GEGLARRDLLAVVITDVKRRAEDDTGQRLIGSQRRPGQAAFECGDVGWIAYQRVADRQGGAVGSAAHRHAEAARARPPAIYHQRLQPSFDDAQRHANDLRICPARVKASRKARTKSRARGLSPCTQIVRTWRSRTSHST